MEFVEDGFKFFTICCKLKTTNLKLKKEAVLMRQPLFCSQRLAVSSSRKIHDPWPNCRGFPCLFSPSGHDCKEWQDGC
jgi:hypothetical protein